MKSKQVLDIQQMQHLQNLGLDTSNASMCWVKDTEGNQHLSVHDEYCYEANFMNPVPAYTLQDVLDALPIEIKYKDKRCWLCIDLADEWVGYYYENIYFAQKYVYYEIVKVDESLIDAAYKLLCWCIEDGYVETNKNDEV